MLRAPHFTLVSIIGVLCALLCELSLGQSESYIVSINSQSNGTIFNPQIRNYADEQGALTIDLVTQLPDAAWTTSGAEPPNFGMSEDTHWFKVSLRNQDARENDFVLLCDYGALDDLSVFWVDPKTRKVIGEDITGDHSPFSSRPIEHLTYAFPFQIEANGRIDAYIRVRSGGNIVVPLSVFESTAFYRNQKHIYMTYTVLLTVMFLTAIYNFFIYIRTKEYLFLTFSVFAFFMTLVAASLSRLSSEYLWPDWVFWGERMLLIVMGLVAISHLNFSTLYLDLKDIFKKIISWLMVINVILLIAIPIVEYRLILKVGLFTWMLTAGVTFVMSSMLWARGQTTAKIYTIAWSIFIIGMIVTGSIRFGITQFNWFTEFLGIFGAVFTTAVLSMALGDRIRAEKQNRIEAQNSAIKNLERYETLFENSVEGVFIIDRWSHFTAANPAFLNLFGYPTLRSLQEDTEKDLGPLFENPEELAQIKDKLQSGGVIQGKEMTLLRRDGEAFWVSMSVHTFRSNVTDDVRIEGSIVDITQRKKTEEKLKYLASHDPLTQTFNRREFESQLSQALSHSREKQQLYCLLYMDLDQFKVLNDTCGHTAGDILLRELTQLMIGSLSNRGMLARLGGDEFGVLLMNMGTDEAYKIAQELLTLIRNYRFTYKSRMFSLGVSIGLVEISQASESVENIMSLADTACYVAKDAGRNQIHVYSADSVELQKRRTEMELVISINNAIEKDLFELNRQIIVSSKDKQQRLGYEILIRMKDEKGHLVPPNTFIPAAERFNLMKKIDRLIIEKSFIYLASAQCDFELEHYSINLSGQSMADESFAEYLASCFERYKIPYENICFEITETAAVYNLSFLLDLMKQFQDLGCTFSLDDFGSGFSSYGYLKNLPVDYLKIDGSFVVNIGEDQVDYAMVKSINEVAKALGMQTIAEFVEDQVIIDKLEEIGVDYLQGYGIAKPEKITAPGESQSHFDAIDISSAKHH